MELSQVKVLFSELFLVHIFLKHRRYLILDDNHNQINKSNQFFFLLEIFKFTQIFPKLIDIMNHSILKHSKWIH